MVTSQLTKEEKLAVHAKKRFLDRFNYSLTDDQLKSFEIQICDGEYELVFWEKGEPGIFKINFKEIECYAVFDYESLKIITFLTKEMKFKVLPEELDPIRRS